MSYDKKQLAALLKTIVENASTEKPSDKSKLGQVLGGAGSHLVITPEGLAPITGKMPDDGPPTIFISVEGVRAKLNFAKECMRDDEFYTRIGTGAVESMLNKFLQTRLQNPSAIPSEELDYPTIVKTEILKPVREEQAEWTVRTIINNLQVESPIKIGNVEFTNFDVGDVANTRMILEFKGLDDPQKDAHQKAGLLKGLREVAEQGTAWATVRIRCHEKMVTDVALQEIETAMNAVRTFAHIFRSRDLRPLFGFPHEVAGGTATFIGMRDSGFSIQWGDRRYLSAFGLTPEVLAKLRQEHYFDAICECITKATDDLTSLQKAIRVAVQWMGRSLVALSEVESFMNIMIALERMLIVDKEATTVENFADRLSFLIIDESKHRVAFHARVKALYDVRSKIVHAGNDFVDTEDLNEIENIALASLNRMCEFNEKGLSQEDVRKVLLERKLGVANG